MIASIVFTYRWNSIEVALIVVYCLGPSNVAVMSLSDCGGDVQRPIAALSEKTRLTSFPMQLNMQQLSMSRRHM